jgi:hypothetical protein
MLGLLLCARAMEGSAAIGARRSLRAAGWFGPSEFHKQLDIARPDHQVHRDSNPNKAMISNPSDFCRGAEVDSDQSIAANPAERGQDPPTINVIRLRALVAHDAGSTVHAQSPSTVLLNALSADYFQACHIPRSLAVGDEARDRDWVSRTFRGARRVVVYCAHPR